MSNFEQLQRKSRTSSTGAAPTSHRLQRSRLFDPAPVAMPEQASSGPQTPPQHSRGFSLTDIPILSPERQQVPGLPGPLKIGIEKLSGLSLDGVKVHYNSPKAARMRALAYTAGSHIYLGPGQERHLPHEAWHAAQQKQAQVRSTRAEAGIAINDDQHLEREADIMGNKALQQHTWQARGNTSQTEEVTQTNDEPANEQSSAPDQSFMPVIQRKTYWRDLVNPPAKDVRYSQVNVQGITTPKRMEARGLTKYNVKGGTKRQSPADHSPLYLALFKQHLAYGMHDLHLLHEELGGQGKPPNLVAAPEASNNAMMDFERYIIEKVRDSETDPTSYVAFDYEVAINYGRKGHGPAAALPTSLDLRATEQMTPDNGASWIDDGPTLVRNVAVQLNDNFPAADPAQAPGVETPIGHPFDEKNPAGRVLNARYLDFSEVIKNIGDSSKLYHSKNNPLISQNVEDPHFVWTEDKVRALLSGPSNWKDKLYKSAEKYLDEQVDLPRERKGILLESFKNILEKGNQFPDLILSYLKTQNVPRFGKLPLPDYSYVEQEYLGLFIPQWKEEEIQMEVAEKERMEVLEMEQEFEQARLEKEQEEFDKNLKMQQDIMDMETDEHEQRVAKQREQARLARERELEEQQRKLEEQRQRELKEKHERELEEWERQLKKKQKQPEKMQPIIIPDSPKKQKQPEKLQPIIILGSSTWQSEQGEEEGWSPWITKHKHTTTITTKQQNQEEGWSPWITTRRHTTTTRQQDQDESSSESPRRLVTKSPHQKSKKKSEEESSSQPFFIPETQQPVAKKLRREEKPLPSLIIPESPPLSPKRVREKESTVKPIIIPESPPLSPKPAQRERSATLPSNQTAPKKSTSSQGLNINDPAQRKQLITVSHANRSLTKAFITYLNGLLGEGRWSYKSFEEFQNALSRAQSAPNAEKPKNTFMKNMGILWGLLNSGKAHFGAGIQPLV